MKALKRLEQLNIDAQRERYPSIPAHAIPRSKYSDKTANGLTKCVIDFLKLSGWQAERISVQGRYVDNTKIVTNVIGQQKKIGSGKWIKTNMQPGSADISATIQGRSVKIEVKIGADRMSPAQERYAAEVISAGGTYYVCRDFESFYQWYQDNFSDG